MQLLRVAPLNIRSISSVDFDDPLLGVEVAANVEAEGVEMKSMDEEGTKGTSALV